MAVDPATLYALVSDVTRTGEWSPICKTCWWDEGSGLQVGAEPGREFAWGVNSGWVRWGFTLEPVADGTRLTEHWTFLFKGPAGFRERYGADADAQIAERSGVALRGIPETLAAIKRIAESA